MALSGDPASLSALLAREGFIAAAEEAQELLAFAAGDTTVLEGAVQRRLTGEPLAWITGRVAFCGVEVHVDPDVYVTRWLSEPLVWRAVERLPAEGTAVDLCTGCGAIAKVLQVHRPRARVVATDLDPHAVRCAATNGVEVYRGDLFESVPRDLEGRVDVVVAVVPYVPTPDLPLLQRDTFTFETPLAYDGGSDGADILRRVLRDSRSFLRPGGSILLEVGGDQADLLRDELAVLGYADLAILTDEDGDMRGIDTTFCPA